MKRFIFHLFLSLFLSFPVLAFEFESGTAGGSDTEVQFNDSGQQAGDPGLTYNKTTDILKVVGGALNPTDVVNLGTLIDRIGMSLNFWISNQTLVELLVDSENALTEQPSSDPETLTTITFKSSVADNPAPYEIKENTLIEVHFDAKVDAVAGKFLETIVFQLGYVDSDGTSNFTQIGENSEASPVLTSVQTAYEVHIHVLSDTAIPAGKRLWLKVIADSTGGSGSFPTISFYYDSPHHHVTFGVSGDILGNFVQVVGDNMTGPLTSEVKLETVSGDGVLTVAQCRGTVINVTGAHTPVLPDVSGFRDSIGGTCLFYASTAAAFSVDVFASDRISRYGTDQANGEEVTSPGTKGAAILFINTTSAGWEAFRVEGNFTNGG